LAVAICCACDVGEEADYYDAPCKSSDPVAFEPGESVRGFDPEALLQPLFGTWQGRLAWRTGETTELTLSVERDPAHPVFLEHCSGPPGAYTYVLAEVSTLDGALNDTLTGSASAIIPGIPTRDEYTNVSFSALMDWQWQGTVAKKIPGLERYESGYVVLQLEREPGTLTLTSGLVTFSGERTENSGLDRFEIGTWLVEAKK
jgi:hypothetical protein